MDDLQTTSKGEIPGGWTGGNPETNPGIQKIGKRQRDPIEEKEERRLAERGQSVEYREPRY